MVSMPQKVVARLFKIGRQAGAIAKWGIVVGDTTYFECSSRASIYT